MPYLSRTQAIARGKKAALPRNVKRRWHAPVFNIKSNLSEPRNYVSGQTVFCWCPCWIVFTPAYVHMQGTSNGKNSYHSNSPASMLAGRLAALPSNRTDLTDPRCSRIDEIVKESCAGSRLRSWPCQAVSFVRVKCCLSPSESPTHRDLGMHQMTRNAPHGCKIGSGLS